MTIQELVEKHYGELFTESIEIEGDGVVEILVEIKTLDGVTVRQSWSDRNKRLTEEH